MNQLEINLKAAKMICEYLGLGCIHEYDDRVCISIDEDASQDEVDIFTNPSDTLAVVKMLGGDSLSICACADIDEWFIWDESRQCHVGVTFKPYEEAVGAAVEAI